METVRIREPGWKRIGSGIRDKHPGSATLLSSNIFFGIFKVFIPLCQVSSDPHGPQNTHHDDDPEGGSPENFERSQEVQQSCEVSALGFYGSIHKSGKCFLIFKLLGQIPP
jgi:hypothetical protein